MEELNSDIASLGTQMVQSAYGQTIKLEPDNKPLLEYLLRFKEQTFGPKELPLTNIQRTVGPESGMLNFEEGKDFEGRVESIVVKIQDGLIPQPLLVEYDGVSYVLLDGNHTHEALVRLGYETYKAYIVNTDIVHELMDRSDNKPAVSTEAQ